MNDPDPTMSPTVAATTPLRDLLVQFWHRAGRPDARRMAAETNLAPGLFTSFLASTGFPGLDETDAMARAVAPPAWHDVLIRRWHDTNAQRHSANPLPLPRRSGPASPTAVGAALAAVSRREFARALTQLKAHRQLTYEQIEKNSNHVVSKSAAQRFASTGRSDKQDFVDAFLRACGVDDVDRDLWLTAWRRVNRNSEPPAKAAGPRTPASEAAAPTPAASGESAAGEPANPVSQHRLLGLLAAASLAGSAAAAAQLCRSPVAQRWLLFIGLGSAGAVLLIALAELAGHLRESANKQPGGAPAPPA